MIDAERELEFVLLHDVPATDIARNSADKCAIACEYTAAIFDATGIKVTVAVLRGRLHVRWGGDGPIVRYFASPSTRKHVKLFDDEAVTMKAGTPIRYRAPTDRDKAGKTPGSHRHGKDASEPKRKVVGQNHERRKSAVI